MAGQLGLRDLPKVTQLVGVRCLRNFLKLLNKKSTSKIFSSNISPRNLELVLQKLHPAPEEEWAPKETTCREMSTCREHVWARCTQTGSHAWMAMARANMVNVTFPRLQGPSCLLVTLEHATSAPRWSPPDVALLLLNAAWLKSLLAPVWLGWNPWPFPCGRGCHAPNSSIAESSALL